MKSTAKKTTLSLCVTLCVALCIEMTGPFAFAQDHKTWKDYGGGPDTSRFTALDQIKKSNVKQLEVAWTYFNGSSGMNPIIVDDVMYVYGRNNSIIALNAVTGQEI